MKRLLACVSLVAVTTTAASAAPAPKAAAASAQQTTAKAKAAPAAHGKKAVAHKTIVRVAPADEYFGKLKLSVLGIRNTIKDVGLNVDVDPGRWSGLENKANYAEDAMHDWEHKYPKDSWLAKSIFALERMYAKIDSDDGRKRSLAAMNWLIRDFPATWYGKQGRREIAEHRVGHAITPPVATAAVPVATPAAALVNAPVTPVTPVTGGTPTLSPAETATISTVPAPAGAPAPAPSAAAK